MQQERAEWVERVTASLLVTGWLMRLVFLDETAVRTDMTRSHGRGPRGKRIAQAIRRRTTHYTLVGAMRLGSMLGRWMHKGGISKDDFAWYIEHVLLPTLKPGDILVMDNLKAHKDERVAKMLADKDVTILFVPRYSPEFNPIEMAWSKLKALIRKDFPRDLKALDEAIVSAWDQIEHWEIKNFFGACGYGEKKAA